MYFFFSKSTEHRDPPKTTENHRDPPRIISVGLGGSWWFSVVLDGSRCSVDLEEKKIHSFKILFILI